jgi:tetratricopeptide (TPR) repeat protein
MYNLARLHHAEGRLERAADLYHEVIRLRHDTPEAHFNLGSVLHELGQYEESSSAWKTAVDLRPDLARLLLGWIGGDCPGPQLNSEAA